MANDGFFKCETPGCGYTIKVYVRDWQVRCMSEIGKRSRVC